MIDDGQYRIDDGQITNGGVNENQIEWYKWAVNGINESAGYAVPNMAFMHVGVPEYAEFEEGFIMGERKENSCVAKVNAGDNLLIMGAGPIGLFALLKVKAIGANVAVADMLESRLALAEEYGADLVINVKEKNLDDECKKFTDGNGFDVCVEACGAPETFLNCIDNSAHGAKIILIGNGKRETTFVHSVILKKKLNIFGSRNAFTKDFEELIDLVKAEKVNPIKMISGIYDAENAAAAFDSLSHNDGSLAKLLIKFSDAE